MPNKFCASVERILRSAGWSENRDVAPLDGVMQAPLFPKAEEVLRQFRGLHFGECGPGIDCATSDVEIDPSLALYLLPEIEALALTLGTRLFPLGEVCRGHGYLIMDEQGATYLLSDVLEPYASSFAQALEMLLLGKRNVLPR